MFTAAIAGFTLGLSLILAIGAQNAFVLRQGLRGEYVFAVCLVCALSDAVLITIGITGLGVLTETLPWLDQALRLAGAAFLFIYGARAFWQAWRKGEALQPSEAAAQTLARTVATALALTWLNPHVYLDTVLLLGSISTQYEDNRLAFGIGAGIASFSFFFLLGYGAAWLRPFFARPGSWRLLDIGIGLIMWSIAASLLAGG
jgi:L-lysine exporter family protein LysE/ArgO